MGDCIEMVQGVVVQFCQENSAVELKNLCELGIIDHQWIPIHKEDTTTYRCIICKQNYDVEILNTNVCPGCGKIMIFRGFTFYRCSMCGLKK